MRAGVTPTRSHTVAASGCELTWIRPSRWAGSSAAGSSVGSASGAACSGPSGASSALTNARGEPAPSDRKAWGRIEMSRDA
jgi:hypothetical protein